MFEQRFYVYLHKTNDGEIKYVGKGTGHRAWAYKCRSKEWKNFFRTNDLVVEIFKENLTDSQSREIEFEMIQKNSDTILNVNRNKSAPKVMDYDDFHRHFQYDESSPSGLIWKESTRHLSRNGKPAGTLGKYGYWILQFKKKQYMLHRVIYFMHNKLTFNSDLMVDHIDRDRGNNKIANLRQVTASENTKNSKPKTSNTGISNIFYCEKSFSYRFKIKIANSDTIVCKMFSIKKYKTRELAFIACLNFSKDYV